MASTAHGLRAGTRRRLRRLLGLIGTAALVGVAPRAWAVPLGEAKMIIELNATDEDAGVQFSIDGPAWSRLEIRDPNGQRVADLATNGSMGLQGINELFCESAEPSLQEQPLSQLFARFPEGVYTFDGLTVEGKPLSGRATFKHNLPAGPRVLSPEEGSTLNTEGPVVIDWDPVAGPYFGTTLPVAVTAYQVIVERGRSRPTQKLDVIVPGSLTQLTMPAEFIQPGSEYHLEVLAIDESGNQTITTRTFKTR